MKKRVLIVGTVPYKRNGPSRAFDSYFAGWEAQSLAQVFSNPMEPVKGHCGMLYQVTDSMLVSKWLHPSFETGKVYFRDELKDEGELKSSAPQKTILAKTYKIGSKHTPVTHLMRKVLWRKKYWCNSTFVKWLDDFAPECVFVSFSNDFFIFQIAEFVAERFNIPIVPAVGDDYFFNDAFSISPFYHIYRNQYKTMIRKLMKRCKYAVYISDKIRDKYNEYFNLYGETVYLASDFERREFRPINTQSPVISYFGNVLLDRYLSLIDIANALKKINPSYKIQVYSGQIDEKVGKEFDICGNIEYHKSVPYSEVKRLSYASDILLAVEGFTSKNINATRYSLSTKAADSLKSGVCVFAYGSDECGLIDYFIRNNACCCCTKKIDLVNELRSIIDNVSIQKYYYDRGRDLSVSHHNTEVSTLVTEKMINAAITDFNMQN